MGFRLCDIFRRKARRGTQPDRSNTPLYKAVREGNVTKVRRLLERGADPNTCGAHHLSVLHIAAYWGETEIVKLLIEHKADVNFDNGGKGWTPLHSAALAGGFKNHGEIISLLVKAGANAEAADRAGYTPKDYMMLWETDAFAAVRIKAQMAQLTGMGESTVSSVPHKPQRVHTPPHAA